MSKELYYRSDRNDYMKHLHVTHRIKKKEKKSVDQVIKEMISRQRRYLLKLHWAYMRLYLLKPKPREAELIKSPREVRLWHSLSNF